MSDLDWCRLICKIDGRAYKAWLERFAPQTGATQKQIDKLVGYLPERTK